MFGDKGRNSIAICHYSRLGCSLTLNEPSPNKHQKIKSLFHSLLPSNDDIRITGWDPIKFGVSESATYDKVLLLAPSSDERNRFTDENQMKKWTSKVTSSYEILFLFFFINFFFICF